MSLNILLLIIINSAFAQHTTSITIPNEIVEQMSLKVRQGECQKEWVEDLASIKVFSTDSPIQKIYAAPCSFWTYNQAWSIFLVINGSDNRTLVRPMYFIRHSSYKGLYADSLVENISWNTETKTLRSRKFLDRTQSCGERADYQWNESHQSFKTLDIYKNDNCIATNKKWEKVF